ncbi:hypothetical protein D3C71_1579060 [compost metagenome]
MVNPTLGGEEQGAPVEHRPFRQEHDKAQDADKHHPAAWHDEHRSTFFTAAFAQQIAAGYG